MIDIIDLDERRGNVKVHITVTQETFRHVRAIKSGLNCVSEAQAITSAIHFASKLLDKMNAGKRLCLIDPNGDKTEISWKDDSNIQ